MTNIPILRFSYLSAYDMKKLSRVMVVKPYALRCVIDNYTLTRDQDDPMIQLCSIIEIPFGDLQKIQENHRLLDTYNNLVNTFGQEVVDLCIPKNSDSIKEKIAKIIIFTMDKVYNSDNLRIEFNKYTLPEVSGKIMRAESSIPNMIYEAAQENFDIVDQELSGQLYYIQIERRRNENVE